MKLLKSRPFAGIIAATTIASLFLATMLPAAYNPLNVNGQATMANSQPVVIASDQSAVSTSSAATEVHLGEVAGNTTQSLATVTRPANTTAYVALQSVNTSTSAPTIITFSSAARKNGASGYIAKVKAITDQSTNVARVRLHLFNVNNPTISNDGSAYTMKYADRAGYLGSIDLPAFITEGSGSDCARAEMIGNLLPFKCAVSDSNLYGLLETLDAFTPNSSQNFHLEIMCESN